MLAVLLACGGTSDVRAQQGSVIDADIRAYHGAPTDSLRLIVLDTLVRHIWKAQAPVGLDAWTDTLLRIALPKHDTARIRAAYALKGEYLSRAGEFVKLEELTRKSLDLVDPEKEPRTYITMLMHASYATAQRGDPDLALERLLVALKYADREGVLPGTRAMLKYSLGRAYVERGEPAKALPYFRESIQWSRSKPHPPSIAQNLNYLGRAHRAMGSLDSALMEQVEGIGLVRGMNDRLELARQLVELGALHHDRHEPELARSAFKEAMLLADSARSNDERVRARLGLAKLDALQRGNALPMLLEAEAIADSIGLYPELREIELLLTQAYAGRGENNKALIASQRVVALGDTLFNIGKRKALLALSMRYETEQKDKAIASLEQEKELQAAREEEQRLRIQRQQQWIIGGAVIGALLLLASVFAYHAFTVKRKAAAQLQAKNAEVLRQKERAEESERAKDRFLANVSHEVRTPLNAIMGFTGLLMHEAQDERTARFLGNIREAGDNLLVVINDVLDLSRIEAGRLRLVSEPFDLHRCVRLCAEIMQHRAAEHDNALHISIAPEVPRWVSGDSARLTQVLLNLMGNALKFTHEGDVQVAVAPAPEGGGHWRFTVSDTGIGIPQEKLSTVFERFTQVHDADQRVQGGTGLGLAIVKELVALHHGRVAVESEVGRGTTFTVDIVYEAVPPPEPNTGTPQRTGSIALTGRTVLVAEDNDMNALVTEETLRRNYPEARVERVRDGEELLVRMRAGSDVALVLMDVQMPKRDGISATQELRSWRNVAAQVPIIALTASVLPNDLSRCIAAGMDACVSKPFKPEELVAAIDRLVGAPGPRGMVVGPGTGNGLLAMFRTRIPERLAALKDARARGDAEQVASIIHAVRPQLVDHDPAVFTERCDRLLAAGVQVLAGAHHADLDAFVQDVERALAEL